jgi:hypothetical protein
MLHISSIFLSFYLHFVEFYGLGPRQLETLTQIRKRSYCNAQIRICWCLKFRSLFITCVKKLLLLLLLCELHTIVIQTLNHTIVIQTLNLTCQVSSNFLKPLSNQTYQLLRFHKIFFSLLLIQCWITWMFLICSVKVYHHMADYTQLFFSGLIWRNHSHCIKC